ncbi:MAG: hypothetical protein NC412_05350 [Roseburia sp.]|nr:hypothetical protein [Roseburia sp.]
MSKSIIKEDRVCHILKTQLYYMADNENHTTYKPLNIEWELPINSTQGILSVLKNAFSILEYGEKSDLNEDVIDKIIENDIHPMVSELKDEFDFFIAGIIMAVCSCVDDFSDSDELMGLVKEITGKFICLLESAWEYLDSENDDDTNKDDLEWEIDIDKLVIGMVTKNYKELCEILNEEVKTGKAKQLQLKNWKRYFDWEKDGQKFVIVDIYDTPLPKEDLRRKGNNSIYKNYIELILLQYLSKQNGYRKTFTKRNWLELLGMINNKYGREPKTKLKQLDYCINDQEITLFYIRSNKKLERVLHDALSNLQREKLIIVEYETVIVSVDERGKEHRFIANDYQKKKILQTERDVLKNVMQYKNMFYVYIKNKSNEYYSKVNQKLYDLYGWKYYYKQIKIIYDQPNVVDAIPSKEIVLQKEILNNKIIEFLNDNAKKVYEKKEKEYDDALDEYLNDWIGDKDYLKERVKVPNTWKYPKAYIEAQRILTEELIRIGHSNIEFLPDKLLTVAEENNEFLAWMS